MSIFLRTEERKVIIEALRFAEAERAEETCEWMRVERPYGTYFQAQCSAGIGVLRKHGAVAPYDDPDVLCPYCNRRIVEKGEK
jgi:DNA-directed RNA polymerase subunit RPC12/RpoP